MNKYFRKTKYAKDRSKLTVKQICRLINKKRSFTLCVQQVCVVPECMINLFILFRCLLIILHYYLRNIGYFIRHTQDMRTQQYTKTGLFYIKFIGENSRCIR